MSADKALLSYRERVAQERQRIKDFMQCQDGNVVEAWGKTRITRRFALGSTSQLHAWSSAGRKGVLYSITALEAQFDFKQGVTATVVLTKPDLEIVTRSLKVGRDPVHLGEDVFLAVDSVEPFVPTEDGQTCIRLIAYSGAGPEGVWPLGTVVGTKEEFNFTCAG